MREEVTTDSLAGVRDLITASVTSAVELERNASLIRRELYGVVQQVCEYLLQARGVAFNSGGCSKR